MDILEQLEAEVSEILARNRELLAAAKQARGLLADSEEKCSALKEENLMLRQSLDREKSLRQEAVARIDALLSKIQARTGEEYDLMSSDNSTLAVLGVQIAVKSGADTTRINEAIALVQKRYDDQVTRSHGSQGKDALLTFTALELADELLQLQKNQEAERQRVQDLLTKIQDAK